MKNLMKNKRGQLALDTVEGVMLKVLIIAILGVSVILALTVLSTGTGSIIDTSTVALAVTNQTTGGINATGFSVPQATALNSSNTQFTLISAFDRNATGFGFVITNNVSLSSVGVVTNTTTPAFGSNATLTYNYVTSYDNGRTSSITANVSNGLVGFFASIGTVFSILLAVVLISAVAIIVLVVRRFAGQNQVSA